MAVETISPVGPAIAPSITATPNLAAGPSVGQSIAPEFGKSIDLTGGSFKPHLNDKLISQTTSFSPLPEINPDRYLPGKLAWDFTREAVRVTSPITDSESAADVNEIGVTPELLEKNKFEPEIKQAEKTLEMLKIAGIEESKAEEMVERVLEEKGIRVEIAEVSKVSEVLNIEDSIESLQPTADGTQPEVRSKQLAVSQAEVEDPDLEVEKKLEVGEKEKFEVEEKPQVDEEISATEDLEEERVVPEEEKNKPKEEKIYFVVAEKVLEARKKAAIEALGLALSSLEEGEILTGRMIASFMPKEKESLRSPITDPRKADETFTDMIKDISKAGEVYTVRQALEAGERANENSRPVDIAKEKIARLSTETEIKKAKGGRPGRQMGIDKGPKLTLFWK